MIYTGCIDVRVYVYRNICMCTYIDAHVYKPAYAWVTYHVYTSVLHEANLIRIHSYSHCSTLHNTYEYVAVWCIYMGMQIHICTAHVNIRLGQGKPLAPYVEYIYI